VGTEKVEPTNVEQTPTLLFRRVRTVRYDVVYLMCSKKLSPLHGQTEQLKEKLTKNKSRSR